MSKVDEIKKLIEEKDLETTDEYVQIIEYCEDILRQVKKADRKNTERSSIPN